MLFLPSSFTPSHTKNMLGSVTRLQPTVYSTAMSAASCSVSVLQQGRAVVHRQPALLTLLRLRAVRHHPGSDDKHLTCTAEGRRKQGRQQGVGVPSATRISNCLQPLPPESHAAASSQPPHLPPPHPTPAEAKLTRNMRVARGTLKHHRCSQLTPS